MSDKSKHKPDGQEDDILEQVISQGLNKLNTPPEEEAASPTEQKPEEKTPPSETKNKRSSVYIYLLILFGAAFMMLLLAYFVQQRNSESTISDLRNSMNLSREEMMEEIEELEKDKETLNTTIEGLRANIIKQRDRIEELKKEADNYSQAIDRSYQEKYIANALCWLERFCAEENYLMAATIAEKTDHLFNEKNKDYWEWTTTPIQVSRYFELRDRLIEDGHVLLLITYTTAEGSEDTEKVLVYDYQSPDVSQEMKDAANAAKYLWETIFSYSMSEYAAAADFIVTASRTTLPERLKDGTFQDATVELIDKITADLVDRGSIIVNEDGTISLPVLYGSENGDRGEPVGGDENLGIPESE